VIDPRDLRQLDAAVRNVRVRLEQEADHGSRRIEIPRQSQHEPAVVVDVATHRPGV
jgi:hypothetical protein